MTHFVFVRYDPKIKKNISSALLSQFTSFHEVWTSKSPGVFLENTNECMEFSGYQEGLLRFINSLDASECKQRRYSLFFANDTALTGHLSIFVRFLLIKSTRLTDVKYSNITGIIMPVGMDLFSVTCSKWYISSWIFMIEGTLDELKSVRFYEQGVVLNNFEPKIYNSLPACYKKAIDLWLNPKSITRGWYQAVPGISLPEATIKRKRFAIYLEHTLPKLMKSYGFEMIDWSHRLDFHDRIIFICLRFLDRIYVNFIKMSFRIKANINRIINSSSE